MDPEIVGLASAAASTLVVAMTQDGWERTKRAAARLWRRNSSPSAEVIEAELEDGRQELLTAERDEVRQDLEAEWKSRLRRLISADPAIVEELRGLLAETDEGTRPVFGSATHYGSGHINQAGRDIHVHASLGEKRLSAEQLSAMTSERTARELGNLPTEEAAWLLAAMPPAAAAATVSSLAPTRVAAAMQEMNPHRCAEMLALVDPQVAGVLLLEVDPAIAIRVLGALRRTWPADLLAEIGVARVLSWVPALGESAAVVVEGLDAGVTAGVIEGMDVRTGVALLERLSPEKCGQVLPKIHRWQRVTLASRMQPEFLEATLAQMLQPQVDSLLRDMKRTMTG